MSSSRDPILFRTTAREVLIVGRNVIVNMFNDETELLQHIWTEAKREYEERRGGRDRGFP
jgi:hypothetical protein